MSGSIDHMRPGGPGGPGPRQRIGVVTVLYHSDAVLEDFFASLAKQVSEAFDFRLYVIDNSPGDSGTRLSRELAQRHAIDAQLIFNDANRGVATGNNQGIALALRDGCTHILLANNDTAFDAGTFAGLLQALVGGQDRVATPKIVYHSDPQRLWYAGGHIEPWTLRTPHHGLKAVDRGQFDHCEYVGYAPTCFMLLDARVFATVGLMDERFFVYYDDTDFAWRLAREGQRIRFVAQCTVQHKVSTSTGGEASPFSVYYTNRNRVFFVRKHLRGLAKGTALAYVLMTRLPMSLKFSWPLVRRMWAGVRDGFRMPIERAHPAREGVHGA